MAIWQVKKHSSCSEGMWITASRTGAQYLQGVAQGFTGRSSVACARVSAQACSGPRRVCPGPTRVPRTGAGLHGVLHGVARRPVARACVCARVMFGLVNRLVCQGGSVLPSSFRPAGPPAQDFRTPIINTSVSALIKKTKKKLEAPETMWSRSDFGQVSL